MRGVSFHGRVQDADVEAIGHGRRVIGGQVLFGFRVAETPPVQDDAKGLDRLGFGFPRRKHGYVVGERQLLGQLALGIVVAVGDKHRDFLPLQPPHFSGEKQSGVEVLPRPVIEVAGNHHEIDAFPDRLVDQVAEGRPRRGAQQLDRSPLIGGQARKGAVEMNVRRVNK